MILKNEYVHLQRLHRTKDLQSWALLEVYLKKKKKKPPRILQGEKLRLTHIINVFLSPFFLQLDSFKEI